MFLKIYIGFSILTFMMLLMETYLLTKKMTRRYPDLVKEFNQKNKTNVLEKIFSWTKTFVCCFVPIMNICIFYVVLFETSQMNDKMLEKLKDEIEVRING